MSSDTLNQFGELVFRISLSFFLSFFQLVRALYDCEVLLSYRLNVA